MCIDFSREGMSNRMDGISTKTELRLMPEEKNYRASDGVSSF